MRSARAKVLHELLGRPLGAYPIELARGLGADPVVAVLGHQREAVEAALRRRFGAGAVTVVEQAEQRGTGHAVRLAMPALAGVRGKLVLVLYGDVPLLRRETLAELVGTARRYRCLAIVTATPPNPTGYGRIVRDQRGHVMGVVEEKDASPEERAITEVNAGIYCGPVDFFRAATAGLSARNAQGEYYLTDIIARARPTPRSGSPRSTPTSATWPASTIASSSPRPRRPCAARINRGLQAHVTFRDPASAVVEPDVEIGVDVELGRNVALRGRTRDRSRRAHRRRRHPHRHRGGRRASSSALTRVATEASIGARRAPWGRSRTCGPGTDIGPDAHIGNFVETKKTTLGRGSKANHLTYLGDTTVGDKVNIGAGTITCNYNGYEKFRRRSSTTARSSGRTRSWWRRCGSARGRWSAPGRP